MEELFFAERGKGAYLNGNRIYVSNAKTMEECLVSVGTDPYNKEELGKRVFRESIGYLRTARTSEEAARRQLIWRKPPPGDWTVFLRQNLTSGIMRRDSFWWRRPEERLRTIREMR